MSIKVCIETANLHLGETIKSYLQSCDFEVADKSEVADFMIYSTDLAEPSAYALCQELRQRDAEIPIVILSNEISLGEDVKARYAGATHVFVMPIEPTVLSNFIRQGKKHGEY